MSTIKQWWRRSWRPTSYQSGVRFWQLGRSSQPSAYSRRGSHAEVQFSIFIGWKHALEIETSLITWSTGRARGSVCWTASGMTWKVQSRSSWGNMENVLSWTWHCGHRITLDDSVTELRVTGSGGNGFWGKEIKCSIQSIPGLRSKSQDQVVSDGCNHKVYHRCVSISRHQEVME